MQLGRAFRLLVSFVIFASLCAGSVFAQQAPLGTPIEGVPETVTPATEPTGESTPDQPATATVEPTSTPESPVSQATPTATGEAVVPAAASPTATPVSGVVDNGDGSYTLTANPGDTIDLDLSSMLPAGGITFGQIVSLSATIVSITGSCSNVGPVFYLNDFVESPPTQGVTIALGDPNSGFACSTGATGNLIDNGARFFTYHADQSGGPSDGSYSSMLTWLGSTNLPGMKFRLGNDGSLPLSVTVRDFAISVAPIATLNVTVQLCQTADADALARKVDYALDPFGPAAVPDCTFIDPSNIGITTSLLDAGGSVFASFDAVTTSDGSISPTVSLGSATSMQFSEHLMDTTSDPIAIPSGGGATVGITIYVSGLPGSISLSLVNAITNGGLSGSVFALYQDTCTGTPIETRTTDSNGSVLFREVLDGTYCVAQTAPRLGYQPIDAIPPFVLASGQSAVLGPYTSDPPTAALTVHFVDASQDVPPPAPGICAGIYQHSGFPDSPPSGELAPLQCDTDGDGAITYQVPVDVSFEVTTLVLPFGWGVGGPYLGMLSPNDVAGGASVTQDVFSDAVGLGGVEIMSLVCPVTDASQARVEMSANDGSQAGTPVATPGCTPFDATYQVVPYGVGNGYTPETISTLGGVASLQLPWTGPLLPDAIVPNTLHALVDNQRPGASGEAVEFDVPTDGVSSTQILILVYEAPGATPTSTATATATATWTAIATAEPTVTPGGTVVALPNTGAGSSDGSSTWLLGIVLVLAGITGFALMLGNRARAKP